ncbi:MAG: cob(I)yrinic acid a,c-diamide adenosyltransferase [Candidatus Heimdallarchaeota archaeon]|nr:cob(I)yrinic acid a,c-diamide adenosyltransferase [Candidatus Heimdallarchaeota archaeon]
MKIYTKKGDDGLTAILGPDRLSKDHIRIESYGTIDELNSVLGMCLLTVNEDIKPIISTLQSLLFELGSDLASQIPMNTITTDDVNFLEKIIDEKTEHLPELKSFILPGGTEGSSWLHLARTVARRAERLIVSLNTISEINGKIIPFVNRLSDLLFVLARLDNYMSNINDITWKKRT